MALRDCQGPPSKKLLQLMVSECNPKCRVTKGSMCYLRKIGGNTQGCLDIVLKFERSLQPELLHSDESESASECSDDGPGDSSMQRIKSDDQDGE